MCNNCLLIRYIRWKRDKKRKDMLRIEIPCTLSWRLKCRLAKNLRNVAMVSQHSPGLQRRRHARRRKGNCSDVWRGCMSSCLSNSCHKEATKWYRKGKIVYVYTLESMNEVEYREPPPRDYYHSLLSFREKWNIRDITWMDGYWDVWYYDDLF